MDKDVQILLLAALSYPFFWFISFDPNLKVRLLDFPNPGDQDISYGPVQGWFSFDALIFTVLLGLLAYFSASGCDLHPKTWLQKNTVVSILAVTVATKVIFAPSASKYYSVKLSPTLKPIRPWKLKIIDFVSLYPANYFQVLFIKFCVFGLFWIVIKIISLIFGSGINENLIVPAHIFAAWVILYFGRMAKFYLNLKQIRIIFGAMMNGGGWSSMFRFLLGTAMLIGMMTVYILLEHVLTQCGGTPGELPDYGAVLAGLAFTPILDGLIVVAGALLALFGKSGDVANS